jgi:phosphatidylinositol N-acetylglucosaminyltransferase subunit P
MKKKESLRGFLNKNQPDSKELNGFILIITSYFLFILYIIWAFLPENFLKYIEFTYYPNKNWALFIPTYVFVLFLLWDLFNVFYVHYKIPDLKSKTTFQDDNIKKIKFEDKDDDLTIPSYYDLTIEEINSKIF